MRFYVSLIFFAAAIPYAWMGLYAWKKRPAVAVTSFAWMTLCFSIWSAAYGMEIALPRLSDKLTALFISYFGLAALPLTLAFFALEFTGRNHLLSRRARISLLAIPVLAWLFFWSGSFHNLMVTSARLVKFDGVSFLVVEYGPVYWIFSFFWLSMTLGAVFLLLAEMIQRPSGYGVQVNLIVSAILTPTFSRILYLTYAELISYLDVSPLLGLPFSLGLSWALTQRYRLQELIPLEYLNALKSLTDGVIIFDESQRALYLNPAAERLLGLSASQAIAQPIERLAPALQRQIAPLFAQRRLRAEIELQCEGRAKTFEGVVSKTEDASGKYYTLTLHDVTERKTIEKALSRRETVMSALRVAAEQFLKESLWEHKIPSVLKKLGEAVEVSHVFVAMNYTDSSGAMYSSLCYEWSAEGVSSQIHNPALQHVSLKQAGMERWLVWLSRNEMIAGPVKNFPLSEQTFLKLIGSVSLAVAPIFVHKIWWGFIMFDECRREREWTNIELEALSIAASLFGSAEERARTEINLIRRQKSLDVLREIVLASLKAEDLQTMARALVQKFAPLIHADLCALALWDDHAKQEVLVAAFDRLERDRKPLNASPADLTLTELALNQGRTLTVEDAPSFYAEQHVTQTIEGASILALPLTAGRKKLGAALLAFEYSHSFQTEEIAICEQAADLISLALEKFQTLEEAERRAATSETLRKASVAIAETLETEEAVNRALEQLKRVVPYDSASVQLLEGNALRIVGGRGFADLKAVLGIAFPIPGENPNTLVIQTGKPRIFNEIGEIYEVFKHPPHNHIRSWLGAPLIFQERVIGLLAIDSAQPNRFTEKDVQLAVDFANQVAVALENARLFKETQEQALTDALTGAYNRRGLFHMGELELARARRAHRPFSLLMFDIDHFKKINDQYGHPVGDQILRGLTERCRGHLRALDVICRYGGEEFVVFLPETNLSAAQTIAERIRRGAMETAFETGAGALSITISVGVTQAEETDSLKHLIERADYALYNAKRAGRNRVALSGEDAQNPSHV